MTLNKPTLSEMAASNCTSTAEAEAAKELGDTVKVQTNRQVKIHVSSAVTKIARARLLG
jgi:hypothetical protein